MLKTCDSMTHLGNQASTGIRGPSLESLAHENKLAKSKRDKGEFSGSYTAALKTYALH